VNLSLATDFRSEEGNSATLTVKVTVDTRIDDIMARLQRMERETKERLEKLEREAATRQEVDFRMGSFYCRFQRVEDSIARLTKTAADHEETAMVDAVMMDELWEKVSGMVPNARNCSEH
jgi:hypothetical protein